MGLLILRRLTPWPPPPPGAFSFLGGWLTSAVPNSRPNPVSDGDAAGTGVHCGAVLWRRGRTFASGTVTNVQNISIYGAVSAANPLDPALGVVSCTNAIYAAIATWTQETVSPIAGFTNGGVEIGEGNFYIDRPIFLPTGCTLFGQGSLLSNLIVGAGTPSTPSLVQGFGGPMIYVTGPGVACKRHIPNVQYSACWSHRPIICARRCQFTVSVPDGVLDGMLWLECLSAVICDGEYLYRAG